MKLHWLLLMTLALVWQGLAATNGLSIAGVRIDAAARAISFAAEVNMRTGLVEYLVVHETGKTHESIFKTKINAGHIHAAALLFSKDSKLKVNVIDIAHGAQTNSAAALILDKDRKKPLGQTKWAYRGSRLVDKVFLAGRDGSIIAIMEDRDALIDQDTPDAANDENWEPVAEKIPPPGTPVTVTIRFD